MSANTERTETNDHLKHTPPDCSLCRHPAPQPFAELQLPGIGQRHYLHCTNCDLVWLHPDQLPAPEQERRHYGTHENNPEDAGYRDFLNRLAAPLLACLPRQEGLSGLDYGCGPGPTLSVMLREAGHRVRDYDPFFLPDQAVLADTYDFITCTETVEHFHRPALEFERLNRLLRPAGWLGLMTALRDSGSSSEAFAAWHYVRDPTHVCFYSLRSMLWLAEHYGWQLSHPARDVILMRKPD